MGDYSISGVRAVGDHDPGIDFANRNSGSESASHRSFSMRLKNASNLARMQKKDGAKDQDIFKRIEKLE